MILVVDPGDTSGVAIFTEEGKFVYKGQYKFEPLLTMLLNVPMLVKGQEVTKIIVEDYRLRAGKQAQQTGSRFQAVQVIGALKLLARQGGFDLELATTQAKTMGAMYSGIKPPSNHSKSHEIDAYNIGIYWLVSEKVISVPALAGLVV